MVAYLGHSSLNPELSQFIVLKLIWPLSGTFQHYHQLSTSEDTASCLLGRLDTHQRASLCDQLEFVSRTSLIEVPDIFSLGVPHPLEVGTHRPCTRPVRMVVGPTRCATVKAYVPARWGVGSRRLRRLFCEVLLLSLQQLVRGRRATCRSACMLLSRARTRVSRPGLRHVRPRGIPFVPTALQMPARAVRGWGQIAALPPAGIALPSPRTRSAELSGRGAPHP